MSKVINKNAAGIDIASNLHYVAVSAEKSSKPVRSFKGFTQDLHQLAQWLVSLGIETVAMESTGCYWYDLYTILLDYGLEVYLVNAQHVKNVPGRKTDVIDAQWLQELHENGYLTPCFQPDNLTRELRTYVRLRKQLIQQMTRETQHMQKAMVNMNIKLHDVISDINGDTGSQIVTAILKGERNPEVLSKFRNYRIKCSKEILIKSLEGNWREEQLFCLRLARDTYREQEMHLSQVDSEIEKVIIKLESPTTRPKAIKPSRIRQKQPKFNTSQYLYNVYGTDVTLIYGVKDVTALTVLSETGPNLKEKFPSVKQFLSWLNLVPDNKISGGKILSSRVRKRKNKAGQAFREAANSLWRAQNPFGDNLRSKKAKSGSGQALVATAKKLATIYYKLVTEKVEFDPYIIDGDRKAYLENQLVKRKKSVETIESQLAVYV